MKNKHIILLFIAGFAITNFAAFFKIMHYPFATILLTIGMLTFVAAFLIMMVKLSKSQKFRDFLNK